jgi:hypothetical protein
MLIIIMNVYENNNCTSSWIIKILFLLLKFIQRFGKMKKKKIINEAGPMKILYIVSCFCMGHTEIKKFKEAKL